MSKRKARKKRETPNEGRSPVRAKSEAAELRSLKEKVGKVTAFGDTSGSAGKQHLGERAGAESVQEFIQSLAKEREQRKYQLSLIQEFISDPDQFGLDTGTIPTSTTAEDLQKRKKELEYRIALSKTFLQMLEEELKQLVKAELYTQNDAPGSST